MTLYIVACAGLYVAQDEILFRPEPISENASFRFGQELKIPVDENVSLHALYHQVDRPKGVILYLHGNRGNARWCQRQAEMFAGFDHNVLLLDYRGYGKSDGNITSGTQLYNDVQVVYDYLRQDFDEDEIVVVGYSIGTGMASYLAAFNSPSRLVLIAPYISIIDMKNRYFPLIPDFLIKYPLNNQKHLKLSRCPVTIFHGTRDEVIPFEASEKLHSLFRDKVELIALENTGHRRSIFHGTIRNVLDRYL